MRNLLLVLAFTVVAVLSWGVYGPTLHHGQQYLGAPLHPSSLRAFLCVGLAYFLIAVLVPMILLKLRGERGRWTWRGALWSLAAGAAGAIGALGIILAFKFRGRPVYVMPLVFGLAPVVNTFVTMWLARTLRQASVLFYAGVLVVAIGAAGVLFFQPATKNVTVDEQEDGPIQVSLTELIEGTPHTESWEAKTFDELRSKKELQKAYRLYLGAQKLTWHQRLMIPLAIALAALSWGSYGPVLHRGQMNMESSRLRPFLCVGAAYFLIAVLAPVSMLGTFVEPGSWTARGITWALGGGAAGAIGALGIIMAFNFGGKPIYVMPLVFGGAPVVNTVTTLLAEGNWRALGPLFFASLLLVIGGAVAVLVFAPRGGHAPPKEPPPVDPPPPLAAGSSADPRWKQADDEVGEDTEMLDETWEQRKP